MVPVHLEDAEHYRVNNLYWLAPESRRSKLSHRHELQRQLSTRTLDRYGARNGDFVQVWVAQHDRDSGAAGIIKGNAAYIEGKGKRAVDPTTFMRENGGVETSNRADGGLFFRLLAKAGFVMKAAKYGGISPGFPSSQQRRLVPNR